MFGARLRLPSVHMTLDALAHERQFLDHLAPVWLALPPSVRGTFLVEPRLVAHAAALGIVASPSPRPPAVPAQPAPRRDGPLLLVASYGDIKVGRRLGYGPFTFMEHGAGQSYNGARAAFTRNGAYAGGIDRDDVELFLVPNETCAAQWRKHYPTARVELIGSPRLETLPQREPGPGPVVALSFHWQTPNSLGPEAQTAVGEYIPVLRTVADRFRVIGHSHPKGDWPAVMERIYRRAGIPFVADFADVCRQADVYVCDNSTTLFEFAATDRPVVVLNSRAYRRSVEHGLRFWAAADVGIQVNDPGQLCDAIDEALLDAPERQQAREAALDIVYSQRTGGAQAAAEALTAWLESKAAVAA